MITNVLDYLEESAKKYPDKVVFADENHEITYQACVKIAKKIGTEIAKAKKVCSPVAVLIDRDIESLEAFLGVAYSDNFYVPISKKLPVERISIILENVAPLFLICKESDREFLAETSYQGEILTFEELQKAEADEAALAEIRKRHIDTNPLYAIYTSGSSGTPKGVLVCHRSVIDLTEQFAVCFGFDDKEVFGNQAPFDFDVSVKDIYSTLKNGATLCIVTPQMISFPKKLVAYLNEKKITTVIWAVSALSVTASMKGLEKAVPEYLKKVFFSGEVMPVKVLNYWREKVPDAMYVNLYGPTEITCNCTYYKVDREFGIDERLPIGEAFPNTEILLLNPENKPAAEGETGEICVRGTSLALGYYRNPEMTQKAFCQNPVNQDYPELIYRTGDLGRYTNGELYYISRKDFQIKHMGHRIELGEIEANLDRLSYISRSCCIYDGKNEKIYMFYQAQEECRRQIVLDLQKYLPKYMCPNKYVHLESFPLNKNGKIDRKLLEKKYILGEEC